MILRPAYIISERKQWKSVPFDPPVRFSTSRLNGTGWSGRGKRCVLLVSSSSSFFFSSPKTSRYDIVRNIAYLTTIPSLHSLLLSYENATCSPLTTHAKVSRRSNNFCIAARWIWMSGGAKRERGQLVRERISHSFRANHPFSGDTFFAAHSLVERETWPTRERQICLGRMPFSRLIVTLVASWIYIIPHPVSFFLSPNIVCIPLSPHHGIISYF